MFSGKCKVLAKFEKMDDSHFALYSVTLCTDLLPKNKPIYCMGVG